MMELLQNIGFFTVALGIISWLVKSLISKQLDKDIELHKSELDKNIREYQNELDIEMEKERNELKLEFAKFSRIHEERLVIVKNIYKMVVDLEKAMKELTLFMWPATGESKEERRKRVIEQATTSYSNLRDTFNYERIMLNEETCKLIDEMLDKISESIHLDTFEERWGPGGDEAIRIFKKEASDIVDNKITQILSELEKDFRQQLGSIS